jgi:hypothetical protein
MSHCNIPKGVSLIYIGGSRLQPELIRALDRFDDDDLLPLET